MFLFAAIALVAVGALLFWRGLRLIGGAMWGIGAVLLAATVYVAVNYKPYRIPSEAMQPTISLGDRVLARKGNDWKLGDIVIFHMPDEATRGACAAPPPEGAMCAARPTGLDRSINFIKRVVAGPGDRVAIRGGLVIRNGRAMREPYAEPCFEEGCELPRAITVPRGHVVVLGDNRGGSDDSRFWGPLPTAAITGRVAWRYWPLGDFGGI